MKRNRLRRGPVYPSLGTGDRGEAEISAVVWDPDRQSGPRRVSGSRAGIVGVYQRHESRDEKRAALDA
jgi:hypothetical protein